MLNSFEESSVRFKVLALTGAALMPGCQKPMAPQTPGPLAVADTVVVVDTLVVEKAMIEPANEDREAEFRLQLLERDAMIADLQELLRGERQEVVRNMAKLQSQASRAEAASELAEAEIAIRTLKQERGGEASQEYLEGTSMLAQSSTEFGRGNFGGAVYLATQARGLATKGRIRLRTVEGGDVEAGVSAFAIPVPLRTLTRSNVRGGPSTDDRVEFVLDPGTPLNGMSYTKQWVYVVDAAGKGGWIFHMLVGSRESP